MGWLSTVAIQLVISISLALFLFYGLVNIPGGLEEQDTNIWVYAKRKYIRAVSITGEYLGYRHRALTSRALGETFMTKDSSLCLKGLKVQDVDFNGVPVRIYETEDRVGSSPALVWIHGGGWVQGSINGDDCIVATIAKRLGILVVSIDYRLAPEHPYPVPFWDCAKATDYFMNNAPTFDVDQKRIAIGGASAGGNLAAAVTLWLRDQNKPYDPEIQLLLIPCLQASDFNTPSYQLNEYDDYLPKYWMISYWYWYAQGHKGHWNTQQASTNDHTSTEFKRQSKQAKFVDHQHIHQKYIHTSYIPDKNKGGNESEWDKLKGVFLDPYFAPLMAEDLSGLPDAYVATAQYDVLRDDGLLYARRLEQSGVPVVHKHYATGYHPSPLSKGMDDIIEYMQANL